MEVNYLEWPNNMVLVKKTNGMWQICIIFIDLNKAYLMDSYPRPWIDQLMDTTTGHELLSLKDTFFEYNQISIGIGGWRKTTFITDHDLFYYRRMPFGLKSEGMTYHQLVNKVFREQIGHNMQVYIDDMLIKIHAMGNHIDDLEEAFATLHKYQMKPNPTKYTFGVTSGKFLRFMVSY